MSIKSKVLAAAAATLAIIGGVSTVGTFSASAATPQCGQSCIEIFSKEFGTATTPNFVETVSHGVAQVGQPIILHRASDSNPAEDLIPRRGLVSDFYKAGLVSADVNEHYGSLNAAQIEYAPSGVRSGLCVGLATTAYQNEGLTLQKCDTPGGTTVFIVDAPDSPKTAPNGYFPLISGSTTDFTHPLGMATPNDALQHDGQIRVSHLINNPTDVPDSQLWGLDFGVLQ
jgi:hypothetical protein